MDGSTFQFADVPAARRAIGYRLKPDGTYAEEPPLPHGVFGSMGGLLTTAADLGKYVAFHLSAWPARDDEDAGPVRRASVREMAHLWTPSNLTAQLVNGKLQASETGYGFGLRVTSDCRFEQIVAHGGGLPGFGSYMAWLPDYGVGMFAMATLTYSGPSEPISQAWDAMLKTGGLRKRELPPTTLQTEMRDHILNLWKRWDDAEAKQIAAVNFFLDAPSARAAGGDPRAQERGRRVHGRRSRDAGELDAGPVQHDVREGHGRRVLHAGANPAARRAAPGVSEAGVAGRTDGRADRRAGRSLLHAVAIARMSRPPSAQIGTKTRRN